MTDQEFHIYINNKILSYVGRPKDDVTKTEVQQFINTVMTEYPEHNGLLCKILNNL